MIKHDVIDDPQNFRFRRLPWAENEQYCLKLREINVLELELTAKNFLLNKNKKSERSHRDYTDSKSLADDALELERPGTEVEEQR